MENTPPKKIIIKDVKTPKGSNQWKTVGSEDSVHEEVDAVISLPQGNTNNLHRVNYN